MAPRRWLHYVRRKPDVDSNLRAITFPNTAVGPRQQAFQRYILETQELNQAYWAANNRDFEANVKRITAANKTDELDKALAEYYTQRLETKQKDFANFQRATYKRNIAATKLGILACWEKWARKG